jgi:DNA-binding NarL/FixJ family response regulator
MNTPIAKRKKARKLTPRQEQVLNCILQGMNNMQISQALEITYGTAKVMSSKTLKKLGVKTKNEALAKFL